MEEQNMPTNTRKSSSGSGAEPTERPDGVHKSGNGAAEAGINGGTTHGLLSGIKQNVTSRVDEQKNRAAEGLGGIANVFRTAGNELRSENEAVAAYVDMASDQLRRFADQIRQKGVTDMLDDVQDFARRRPALFIGGAFLVGIGIARFLKSSAERQAFSERESSFSSVDPMTTSSVPSYGGSGYGNSGY
jgi:hypothetical protein